jgi:hypothetical protein
MGNMMGGHNIARKDAKEAKTQRSFIKAGFKKVKGAENMFIAFSAP